MQKKSSSSSFKLKFFLGILTLGFLVLALNCLSAIGLNPNNPEDPLGIGLNPEDVPTTEEDLGTFLQLKIEQWFTNSSIMKPIHKFGFSNPLLFNLLLGQKYSISLPFYWSLIIWIFLFLILLDTYELLGLSRFSRILTFLAGFLTTLLLAQIGLIFWIAKTFSALIMKEQQGWISALLFILLLGILIIIKTFFKKFYYNIFALRKARAAKQTRANARIARKESREAKQEARNANQTSQETKEMLEPLEELGDTSTWD